jgi:hypothetical protein
VFWCFPGFIFGKGEKTLAAAFFFLLMVSLFSFVLTLVSFGLGWHLEGLCDPSSCPAQA